MSKKHFSDQRQKVPQLERLHVLFDYDPVSGILFHKLSGDPAGSKDDRGYLRVSIDGDRFYVHHVVWHMFHNKPWLEGCCISHVNGDPADNAISNLRRKRRRWFGRR